MDKGLSKRQADLMGFLYVREDAIVSLQQYAKKHKIVRQTARKDLTDLEKLNLIIEEKQGNSIVFKLKSKADLDRFLNV